MWVPSRVWSLVAEGRFNVQLCRVVKIAVVSGCDMAYGWHPSIPCGASQKQTETWWVAFQRYHVVNSFLSRLASLQCATSLILWAGGLRPLWRLQQQRRLLSWQAPMRPRYLFPQMVCLRPCRQGSRNHHSGRLPAGIWIVSNSHGRISVLVMAMIHRQPDNLNFLWPEAPFWAYTSINRVLPIRHPSRWTLNILTYILSAFGAGPESKAYINRIVPTRHISKPDYRIVWNN